MSLLLYSTNPLIKLLIQERFRGDIHYVWCSDHADSSAISRHSFGALVPPSSNPVDIYRSLQAAHKGGDSHNADIIRVRTSYLAMAVKWHAAGEISETQMQEIIFLVSQPDLQRWRPLLYVIPRPVDASRIKLVPPENRAGIGPEYIIEDLHRSEFDVVEL